MARLTNRPLGRTKTLVALAALLAASVLIGACASIPTASAGSGSAAATRSGVPSASAPASLSADPTHLYLAHLDLPGLLAHAAAYGSAKRPAGDPVAYVETLRSQYRGGDRVAVLREVFARLTAGAQSETDKEKAVLGFVQHLSVHDFANPLLAVPVFDPLVLLAVGAMDCQKASRLIADLYAAAGYRSRIVDMYGHAVAEVSYDIAWHYADADMFGGGQVVTMADGHIPSVAELSKNVALLDRLPVYLENAVLSSYPGATGKNGVALTAWTYPSWAYFSTLNFAQNPGYPAYLSKKVQPATATDPDPLFGWNAVANLARAPASDIQLSDIPSRPSPGIPAIDAISATSSTIHLSIAASGETEVIGYRVFVSSTSRGWDYGQFIGSSPAASSWANAGGWTASMYDRLFRLPPGDVATIDAPGRDISLHLRPGTYFVSVMARDAYGDQVGRVLYPLSNELRVTVPG